MTGSPLHGVLGGIELLRGSQLSPFQEEMSFSVALAGRTLLDTVENILSYSKISNPTRAQKRNQAKVDASRHGSAEVEGDEYLSTVVDLARMTEEVVESVVSAHRFSRSLETKGDEQEPLSVVLNIDKRDSWATAMTPGSWTRVLTNIGKRHLISEADDHIGVLIFPVLCNTDFISSRQCTQVHAQRYREGQTFH